MGLRVEWTVKKGSQSKLLKSLLLNLSVLGERTFLQSAVHILLLVVLPCSSQARRPKGMVFYEFGQHWHYKAVD